MILILHGPMSANGRSQPTHGQPAGRVAGDEVARPGRGLAAFLVRALAEGRRQLTRSGEGYRGGFDGGGAQRTDFDPPAGVVGLDKKGVASGTTVSARFCRVGWLPLTCRT